jgi:hypothetical protein
MSARLSLSVVFIALLAQVCGAPANAAINTQTAQQKSLQIQLPQYDQVRARGGDVQLRWNLELLAELGLQRTKSVDDPRSADRSSNAKLTADSTLDLALDQAGIVGVTGGAGQLLLTDSIRLQGAAFDWSALRLVVSPGDNARIDLHDADGNIFLYVDRIMYKLTDARRMLVIRSADLRMTAQFAARIDKPQFAGATLAQWTSKMPLEMVRTAAAPSACGAPNWPGNVVRDALGNPIPGAFYQADVFLQGLTAQTSRCGQCNADESVCTAVACAGGAPTHVVFTPSSTLVNNRNRGTPLSVLPGDPLGISGALYTADIPWNERGFGTIAPPYGNDQHPYLIWNLYRIDTENGAERISQIGRSGAKHAFLTLNSSPFPLDICERCNGDSVLGRSCGDVYGVGSNDADFALGPRSEIAARAGVWGINSVVVANNPFAQRMRVPVAAITSAAGVRYLFESWYIVRDDINIYNTMGTRSVEFNDTTLSNTGPQIYQMGPAIDRWVSPTTTNPLERSRELDVPEGHAKLAVRVVNLGGGLYRYHYAVMNLDFARVTIAGTASAPSVTNNFGFNRIRIPIAGGTQMTNPVYEDGDALRAPWVFSAGVDYIEWIAPNAASSLNWGVMTSFSVTANIAPTNSPAVLGVTNPGSPAEYAVQSLTPGGLPTLLVDGFEN